MRDEPKERLRRRLARCKSSKTLRTCDTPSVTCNSFSIYQSSLLYCKLQEELPRVAQAFKLTKHVQLTFEKDTFSSLVLTVFCILGSLTLQFYQIQTILNNRILRWSRGPESIEGRILSLRASENNINW